MAARLPLTTKADLFRGTLLEAVVEELEALAVKVVGQEELVAPVDEVLQVDQLHQELLSQSLVATVEVPWLIVNLKTLTRRLSTS